MKVWIKIHSLEQTDTIAEWLNQREIWFTHSDRQDILLHESAQFVTVLALKYSVRVEQFDTVLELMQHGYGTSNFRFA